MKWFARHKLLLFFSALFCSYGCYFFMGLKSADEDWHSLVQRFSVTEKLETKASVRKEVVKHLLYSSAQERFSVDVHASNSTLFVQQHKREMQLHEDLQGVIGSFWDRDSDKAYTLFMPQALFDYPRKLLIGYQAQLEEFDANTKVFLGKGTFGEVECTLKGEPEIKLRKIHAVLEKDH